jgi:hypothetical protein
VNAPAPASTPADPALSRHLLVLISDALSLPQPAATLADEAAYLALVNRRALLVRRACRQALAGEPDFAARDLFGAVSDLPATSYRPARQETRV